MVGRYVESIKALECVQLENFKLIIRDNVCLHSFLSKVASQLQFSPCFAKLERFKVSTRFYQEKCTKFMIGVPKSSLRYFRISSDKCETDLEPRFKSFSVANCEPKFVETNKLSQLFMLEEKISKVFPFAESLIKNARQDPIE